MRFCLKLRLEHDRDLKVHGARGIMRVVVGVIRETTVMLPNLDGLKLGAPTGVIPNADDFVHAQLMFNLVKDVPIWGVEAFESWIFRV